MIGISLTGFLGALYDSERPTVASDTLVLFASDAAFQVTVAIGVKLLASEATTGGSNRGSVPVVKYRNLLSED